MALPAIERSEESLDVGLGEVEGALMGTASSREAVDRWFGTRSRQPRITSASPPPPGVTGRSRNHRSEGCWPTIERGDGSQALGVCAATLTTTAPQRVKVKCYVCQ
jgi:hypothetical protein